MENPIMIHKISSIKIAGNYHVTPEIT